MNSEGRVVVGIDGSEPASQALEWALDYGRMSGLSVAAVAAWTFPAAVYGFETPPLDGWDVEGTTREAAADQLKAAAERHPDVTAHLAVEQGHPSQVLVDASKGARLLVVGSRGRGGFSGTLLGSVSTHCVHAAHCPVVVVR